MSDGWNEELVSVVTDYKIEWQLPAAKQDAIKRLLSSTGAGVGWLEHDGNGPYAVIAVSPPRLANATLTDAECDDLRVWLAECLRQASTATEGANEELAERWNERAKRAAAMIERTGGGR